MKKIIIAIAIISLFVGTAYNKMNKVRDCKVVGVYESAIMVKHPNGRLYTIHTDNIENYVKGETIEVVFDELYEWDTQYEVKGLR